MIVSIIRKCGDHQVIEASDGQEAVEQFTKSNPDFTFLDLNMPVMDGKEALRLIKEINPEALVAVLSADIQKKTVEMVNQLGAMVFINKPVTESRIGLVLAQAELAMNR